MAGNTALWMGDVSPDMDENFIISAFAQMGEPVMKVKIMNSAKTPNFGHSTRYCFVEFPDYDGALRALQRLNGTYIPGMPGRRFKLNTSNKDQNTIPDHSLYVGDLSNDVVEPALCAFFQFRYPSVYSAKVIMDGSGNSRCYGFVRFANEQEYHRALTEMQNATGLGQRPIKVSTATARSSHSTFWCMGLDARNDLSPACPVLFFLSHLWFSRKGILKNEENECRPEYSNLASGPQTTPGQQDTQPWGDYGSGHQYNQQYSSSGSYSTHQENEVNGNPDGKHGDKSAENDDSETLEDPGLEINISKENREFIDSSESFFTALEVSRWQPLDNIMSEIPD